MVTGAQSLVHWLVTSVIGSGILEIKALRRKHLAMRHDPALAEPHRNMMKWIADRMRAWARDPTA